MCVQKRILASWNVLFCRHFVRVAFGCVLFMCATAAAQQREIAGVVSDGAGAAISQASVEFQTSVAVLRTRTNERGEFVLVGGPVDGTLVVQAAGFETVRVAVDAQRSAEQLRIRLQPATLIERIVVSAEDERIPSTPVSQYAIGKREIAQSGAMTIDDALRQVPGFSLFRRSGSLTANPVMIAGTEVQFLLPSDSLGEASIENANTFDFQGVPARVMTPEYLIAHMLKTGRRKDKTRLARFIEARAFDPAILSSILSEHGLEEKYADLERIEQQ